jgi:hypothetical protein
MARAAGISNRKSAPAEARERTEHPPAIRQPTESGNQIEREGKPSTAENRQTSGKAGARSLAQKESESRYPARTMPASAKVEGAFGKEPPRR